MPRDSVHLQVPESDTLRSHTCDVPVLLRSELDEVLLVPVDDIS